MNIKILYEDEDVVVIDKPAGVVVNRAESVVGETVQDWMESKIRAARKRKEDVGWHRRRKTPELE